MNFVEINHIDEVIPHVNDREEFIVVEKDGYKVIDYVFESNDSFDDPYRAECRGLKFDSNGKIIGRPFRKFFNYGQKLIQYDWTKPHTIMTKMDGSMVHTALINGKIRLCTRMGLTEQAMMAEEYMDFDKLLSNYINTYTFIFEFTSPQNQIVIFYDKPQLTLLAIRHNTLGYYMPQWMVAEFAKMLRVNYVERHSITLGDDNISKVQREVTGIEGYVVAWNDGTYVKIKTDEYVQMHRAVSYFDREDMILAIVLDSQCDDLYPTLPDEKADRLAKYESHALEEALQIKNKLISDVDTRRGWSRKDFALWVNAEINNNLRGAYFSVLDGKDPWETVKFVLKKNPAILNTRWK